MCSKPMKWEISNQQSMAQMSHIQQHLLPVKAIMGENALFLRGSCLGTVGKLWRGEHQPAVTLFFISISMDSPLP